MKITLLTFIGLTPERKYAANFFTGSRLYSKLFYQISAATLDPDMETAVLMETQSRKGIPPFEIPKTIIFQVL